MKTKRSLPHRSLSGVPRSLPVRRAGAFRVQHRVRLPDFWAALTFLTFPLAWVVASWLGYDPIGAFLLGAAAMMAILVANRIAEQELWFFDIKWRERFEHPDVSFRLAVVTGALLLIIETTLLVLFFTDGSMDRALLNLVFSRQCQYPLDGFASICDAILPFLNP